MVIVDVKKLEKGDNRERAHRTRSALSNSDLVAGRYVELLASHRTVIHSFSTLFLRCTGDAQPGCCPDDHLAVLLPFLLAGYGRERSRCSRQKATTRILAASTCGDGGDNSTHT